MCDFGITAAVVSTTVAVVSGVTQAVMQAQAAEAQNQANIKKQ